MNRKYKNSSTNGSQPHHFLKKDKPHMEEAIDSPIKFP